MDPTTFRFGAVDKDDMREGVRKALQPGLDQVGQYSSTCAGSTVGDHILISLVRGLAWHARVLAARALHALALFRGLI